MNTEIRCICGFLAKSKRGLALHQEKCLNFDATKPVKPIPAVAKEVHPLNVGGKVIWR